MNEGLLMGLDLGGSGVRCVLVDVADASVVSAVAPWRPSPAADVPLGHAYAPEATWEGHWPHPIQAACRLRWCAEQTPQLLDAAHTHLAISDWLAFRLSGEIATEVSQACETGAAACRPPSTGRGRTRHRRPSWPSASAGPAPRR